MSFCCPYQNSHTLVDRDACTEVVVVVVVDAAVVDSRAHITSLLHGVYDLRQYNEVSWGVWNTPNTPSKVNCAVAVHIDRITSAQISWFWLFFFSIESISCHNLYVCCYCECQFSFYFSLFSNNRVNLVFIEFTSSFEHQYSVWIIILMTDYILVQFVLAVSISTVWTIEILSLGVSL